MWCIHSIICMGKAVEIRDRIKKLFGRKSEQPVVETSQRYPIVAGFIEGQNTVFAALLTKGNENYGARLYTYEEDGFSLEKKILGEMNEQEWNTFKSRLYDAKKKGYIENGKVLIPSSLSEGKRGVYATNVKRLVDGVFVKDGVNIYQTDENKHSVFVRSMNEKTWHNFSKLIAKAQKEEDEIRQASLSKFAILSDK